MEQKIKNIIRQVGDIGDKASRLQVEKPLPSIEIDIILGEIRTLYEKVRDLQLGTSIPAPTTDPGQEQPAETTAPVKETGVTKKMQESVSADKPSEKVETIPEKSGDEPAILADKYQGNKKFINESLAESGRKKDISSKIQSKPIRNISSALGINDRFKLINDLFNGDKDSYQNAINILDGASNFNEAFNYISSSFDWDMEEESVQMLLELVRRKFIVNQNE